MRTILNLTQHPATAEQLAAGVVDPSFEIKAAIQRYLTFEQLPDQGELHLRAMDLFQVFDVWCAQHLDDPFVGDSETWPMAMIGGAPYLMAPIERVFGAENVSVCYAFSQRESVEEQQPDGSVVKRNVFRHTGFVVIEP